MIISIDRRPGRHRERDARARPPGMVHLHGPEPVAGDSNFWAGILAIIFFSLVLHWLPPGGRVADGNNLGESIKSLILPAMTLSLYPRRLSRVKFNLLEVFFDDYVRTARAKGLSPKRGRRTATRCATPCCR